MTIKDILARYRITQTELSSRYGIPLRSIQHWVKGDRECPEYVISLIDKALQFDNQIEK